VLQGEGAGGGAPWVADYMEGPSSNADADQGVAGGQGEGAAHDPTEGHPDAAVGHGNEV
jgi:hypothetical protein